MSDRDSATPGPMSGPAAPDRDGRIVRAPRPAAGIAPWERVPAADKASGNHSEGVAVADLLAKLTGSQQVAPVTRHSADTSAADDPDTTAPIPARALGEIPDLAAITRGRRPSPARRPAVVAGRALAALIAILALALTGAAWQWQSAKDNLLNTIAALDPNSSDILNRSGQNGDENFLIVGVDSRIGANSEVGAGDTTVAEGARSDTIMLVNIPANRKRVVAVSFPRDLAITPMNCQAWNPESGKYGPVYDKNTGEWSDNERETTTKLNSTYALGGPKCLVKAIQKLSGLAVNRFMAVDFAGFSTIVDALGGVEVCSTTPLEDAELGTVLSTAGRQTLDGHTALNYVRARSIESEDNGDYGRIKRQQLFLSSLLREMISTETLFDLNKLNDVVNMFIDDSFVDNVRTRDLVQLGQSLQGVNAGRITFMTVPTTGIADDQGNEQPRTQDIRALFDAIIDDEPLPGENDRNQTLSPLTMSTKTSATTSATPNTTDSPAEAIESSTSEGSTSEGSTSEGSTSEGSTTTTEEVKAVAADPRDVTVAVTNATERSGLADTATRELQWYGFATGSPDYSTDWSAETATTPTKTTVFYSLGSEQAAATVAATFPGANIARVSGLGETVQVVLGSDFTAVRFPAASGSPLTVSVTHTGSTTPTSLPSDLTVTNGADITCE